MMYQQECSIQILAPKRKIVTKAMPVFYNPVMKLNRDIAVLLLQAVNKKSLHIADPLSGTGIRTLRFLKELPKTMIKKIYVNDANPKFLKAFEKNRTLNKIAKTKISIHNTEASKFLLEQSGMDYIDIDPFGSANFFLDAAVKRIAREGILAVTATDTAALAGTYPKACYRKYWAMPLHNHMMHEIGLRILIRKAQLIGAQYDKALVPIFCHASDHYYRIYLKNVKGKKQVDAILAQHEMFTAAGPLWTGKLWDVKLVKKMQSKAEGDARKLLDIIADEAKIDVIGCIDVHKICKTYKIPVPKKASILKKIRKKHKAANVHYNPQGIKTTMPEKQVIKIIRSLG